MDLNDLRTAVMLLSFALFVALMWHTWSRRRRGDHDAAAALPFIDEGAEATTAPIAPEERRGERP